MQLGGMCRVYRVRADEVTGPGADSSAPAGTEPAAIPCADFASVVEPDDAGPQYSPGPSTDFCPDDARPKYSPDAGANWCAAPGAEPAAGTSADREADVEPNVPSDVCEPDDAGPKFSPGPGTNVEPDRKLRGWVRDQR